LLARDISIKVRRSKKSVTLTEMGHFF